MPPTRKAKRGICYSGPAGKLHGFHTAAKFKKLRYEFPYFEPEIYKTQSTEKLMKLTGATWDTAAACAKKVQKTRKKTRKLLKQLEDPNSKLRKNIEKMLKNAKL